MVLTEIFLQRYYFFFNPVMASVDLFLFFRQNLSFSVFLRPN